MERERREESDDSRKREVGRGKRLEGLTDTHLKSTCVHMHNTRATSPSDVSTVYIRM